jgi:hypothetical protein
VLLSRRHLKKWLQKAFDKKDLFNKRMSYSL